MPCRRRLVHLADGEFLFWGCGGGGLRWGCVDTILLLHDEAGLCIVDNEVVDVVVVYDVCDVAGDLFAARGSGIFFLAPFLIFLVSHGL